MRTLAHRRDQAEILRRLRSVRPDSAPHWGRMSAHQMVCHLADAIRMETGQKPVAAQTNWFKRTILRTIALYFPLPWPPGIPTSPEIDQELGGTRPVDFSADVEELVALLEGAIAPGTPSDQRTHPVFGRLSQAAWLRWGYLHLDHHLRQFGA